MPSIAQAARSNSDICNETSEKACHVLVWKYYHLALVRKECMFGLVRDFWTERLFFKILFLVQEACRDKVGKCSVTFRKVQIWPLHVTRTLLSTQFSDIRKTMSGKRNSPFLFNEKVRRVKPIISGLYYWHFRVDFSKNWNWHGKVCVKVFCCQVSIFLLFFPGNRQSTKIFCRTKRRVCGLGRDLSIIRSYYTYDGLCVSLRDLESSCSFSADIFWGTTKKVVLSPSNFFSSLASSLSEHFASLSKHHNLNLISTKKSTRSQWSE